MDSTPILPIHFKVPVSSFQRDLYNPILIENKVKLSENIIKVPNLLTNGRVMRQFEKQYFILYEVNDIYVVKTESYNIDIYKRENSSAIAA